MQVVEQNFAQKYGQAIGDVMMAFIKRYWKQILELALVLALILYAYVFGNVIVPNINKTPASNYDVGIFKAKIYRNWEWSVGYGQHGGDRYVPVELQRNFSKDAAVSVEHHFGGHEKGYEVKYTRKVDKLFFLF